MTVFTISITALVDMSAVGLSIRKGDAMYLHQRNQAKQVIIEAHKPDCWLCAALREVE